MDSMDSMSDKAKAKRLHKRKLFVIIAIVVLIVAAGAVLAYLLLRDTSDTPDETDERDNFTASVEDADKAAISGDVAQALKDYDQGIANSDNEDEEATLVILKGYLLLDDEQYEEALSIARDADNRWQRVNTAELLGDVYAAQDDTANARQAYQTAIDRLNPDDYDYDNARALIQSKIDEL